MGTRADFYVGRGADAEWLGSLGWDGFPDVRTDALLAATTEEAYRAAVQAELDDDCATHPEMGWPWPWGDSNTTDFSYAFDDGETWVTCFGYGWRRAQEPESWHWDDEEKTCAFPDMRSIKHLAKDMRSGLIFIHFPLIDCPRGGV